MYNNISWDSVSGYLTYTMDEVPGYGALSAGKWFTAFGERVSGKEKEMGFNLDDLGNYGTTFIGPYAMTMWPEGGGTIGWEGNLIISSEAMVDLREITTTNNLILLKETVDGATQQVYSSPSADLILLSSGTTIVAATYGDFIEGVVAGINVLNFIQLNTSAATFVLAETDQITTVTFEDDESLQMRNVNHVLLNGADGSHAVGNSLSNIMYVWSTSSTVEGKGGDDYLVNYGNKVTLLGGDGNDYLGNNGNNALLSGDAGDDVLVTFASNTQAHGGLGNDTITSYGPHETLNGDEGDDTLISYGLEARLVGGSGYDTFEAYGDKAEIYGSNLDGEVASFAHFGDRVTVVIFLDQVAEYQFWTDSAQADIIFDTGQMITQHYTGFNDVTGTGGDDMIGGNDEANILNGGGGRDIIEGHGGDDTITVERIGDVDGGDGWDSVLITGNDGSVFGGMHGLHNIEVLDIAGDYTLLLDSTDIIRITDDDNTLVLKGDSNDSLFLYNSPAKFMYNLVGYDMYVGENFTIYVDDDIDLTFVGVPPMEQHP